MSNNFNKENATKLAELLVESGVFESMPNRQQTLDKALEIAITTLSKSDIKPEVNPEVKSIQNPLSDILMKSYVATKEQAWNGELKRIPTEIKLDFALEFLMQNRASRMSRGLCDSLNLGVGFNEWKKWADSRKEWLDDYNNNYADETCTHRETLEIFQANPDYQKLMGLISNK